MKKKLLLFFVICFFLNIINVYSLPTTYNREELENYGVKKDWTLDSNNMDNVLKTPKVDAQEKIYDFSEVLTEEEIKTLKDRIDSFIEKTNMDMVIVTYPLEYKNIDNNICSDLDNADQTVVECNEEFASDFYDYNDFGMFNDNNDGIILFRNTAKDPCFNAMFYDMYTFGSSQLYFTQSRYDDILDSIYDDLHEENYLQGLLNYIDKTEDYIEAGIPRENKDYYVDENGYKHKTYSIPWIIIIPISTIITIITMIIMVKKNKMIMKQTTAEKYLNKKSINITTKKDKFLTSHITKYTESHNTGSSGGFSSHSGSSGGGHSSGGGRHG